MTKRDDPTSGGRAIPLLLALAAMLTASPRSASGQAVPLDPFNLPPGGSVTITFEVDVDNPLDICASAISNQGTFTATNHANVLTDDPGTGTPLDATLTSLDVIDLAITKTDANSTEVPGTSVTFTIVVSNSGPAPAVDATVADDFPAILTGCITTSVAVGATGNDAGPVAGDFTDTGVNLPVGATVTYTSSCTIDAAATGSLINTATVTGAAGQLECDTADNGATDTDTLTPSADVAVTKTNGVTDIDAGSSTTYTIVVSNAGPSVATGVTVTDNFDFTILASCSTTSLAAGGATGNDAGPFAGNINDSGITLPVGGSVTYTSVCPVLGTASGSLSNTASANSPGDPNGGNNSATDGPDAINPIADLSMTKTDGVTVAVPGMTVTYTIVAANAGPATATGASVVDNFPTACATVSWTCVGANGAPAPPARSVATSPIR